MVSVTGTTGEKDKTIGRVIKIRRNLLIKNNYVLGIR
jgi:hypothetical protein